MVREAAQLDETRHQLLQRALELNDRLRTVYTMKQKLVDVWNRRATTQEHLIQALQEWCREAEATGIEALRNFSQKLRTYTLVPVPA
jgi:stearoyl-CoA desaturase (delta-9 desaturase)